MRCTVPTRLVLMGHVALERRLQFGQPRQLAACVGVVGQVGRRRAGRALKMKLKLASKPTSSISFIVFAWSASVSRQGSRRRSRKG